MLSFMVASMSNPARALSVDFMPLNVSSDESAVDLKTRMKTTNAKMYRGILLPIQVSDT